MAVREFRDIVFDFRVKYDLSMEQMAKVVGVTTQTIYNIENRLTHPTRFTVGKVLRAIEEYEKENNK